jgi:putative endonuclease
VRVVSSLIFGLVEWAARNGFAPEAAAGEADRPRQTRRLIGIRGETFAYWYLRRHGYVIIARNFRASGLKGEVDLVGFDRETLAFIEVKTRTSKPGISALPEDAITADKRRFVARTARRFLAERKLADVNWRYDVLAIQCPAGNPPAVRLHKGAFTDR